MSDYGECDGCRRWPVAIQKITGHLANGEATGKCLTCVDLDEKPAVQPNLAVVKL